MLHCPSETELCPQEKRCLRTHRLCMAEHFRTVTLRHQTDFHLQTLQRLLIGNSSGVRLTPWERIFLEELIVCHVVKDMFSRLWYTKIHYLVHKCPLPQLRSVPYQINPVSTPPPPPRHFHKIHFNINLIPISR
jgi:hypothetical protein